jgi:DNA-binding response OmpR family regulator
MKRRPRVLLIDDEAQIRAVFEAYFEDYDEFSFATSASAEEALEVLADDPADVCIVDMCLPGMDGAEFVSRAREGCRNFLIHTGSADQELHQRLQGMGVGDEDYLLKPCDMSHLLQRIRCHLASRDSE